MSIEAAIYTKLSGSTGLTDLTSTRIYPVTKGKATDTLPYVVFQKISDVHLYHMGGEVTIRRPVYQFSCWDSTPHGAEAVARQVAAAINQQQNAAWGSVTVQACFIQNELQDFNDETGRHRAIVDAEICYVST
jgi:hypothetical protein